MITHLHVGMQYGWVHTALSDMNFHIEPREFAFLKGPSGTDESTQLKLLFRQQFHKRRNPAGGPSLSIKSATFEKKPILGY